MQNIKIIVSGTAGSGKTTIATLISSLLIGMGFTVDLKDEEPAEFDTLNLRTESLQRKNTVINIETNQISREKF